MKFAFALLVAGLVAFGVYSLTARPDYDMIYQYQEGTLRAKVQSSEIVPKTVYTTNSLQVKMADAVREEYLYLTVKWFRNNEEIHGFANPVLPSSYTRKGDRMHAEVNLLGPEALDEPVVTSPVTVLNSPPRILEASTVLQTVPTDRIKVRVNAFDADHDRLRFRYRWFRNGVEIPGQTKAVMDVAALKKGDRIEVEVIASDGEHKKRSQCHLQLFTK